MAILINLNLLPNDTVRYRNFLGVVPEVPASPNLFLSPKIYFNFIQSDLASSVLANTLQ